MDEIEIRAGDLLLRPWQADDAPAVLAACQDPDIQRWTGVPRPYRPEHAEHFVTTHTRLAWATGTGAPLGVFDAASGALLGSSGLVSLHAAATGGTAEIGYWVTPAARGRGVAARSTHAVATWSLGTLGLARLTWRATVGNWASRLVAERTGFVVEGILRHSATEGPGGPLVDCWGAALLPGQLRDPDRPLPDAVRRRIATFGAAQPRLTTTTRSGEAISLRPPHDDDLDAIVAACQDPESVRWTTVPDPYGHPDAEYFVRHHGPTRWAMGAGATFAVAGPDDAFAGSMELRIIGREPGQLGGGVGDVGYLVAPWARGQGYASAALARLCRWGFEELGLHRIEWRAYLGNHGSRAVAERAGFTVEGTARGGVIHRGAHRDAWTGAILATDPAARSGAGTGSEGGAGSGSHAWSGSREDAAHG